MPRKVRTKIERKHEALLQRTREKDLSNLEAALHSEWKSHCRYSSVRSVPLAVVELCAGLDRCAHATYNKT